MQWLNQSYAIHGSKCEDKTYKWKYYSLEHLVTNLKIKYQVIKGSIEDYNAVLADRIKLQTSRLNERKLWYQLYKDEISVDNLKTFKLYTMAVTSIAFVAEGS